MFEVTKKYSVVLLEGDGGDASEVTYSGVTVTDVDGPLVKINYGGKGLIVNTHSPHFVRAVRIS